MSERETRALSIFERNEPDSPRPPATGGGLFGSVSSQVPAPVPSSKPARRPRLLIALDGTASRPEVTGGAFL